MAEPIKDTAKTKEAATSNMFSHIHRATSRLYPSRHFAATQQFSRFRSEADIQRAFAAVLGACLERLFMLRLYYPLGICIATQYRHDMFEVLTDKQLIIY